ncbi:MAG: TraX family protein [Ruthenibacterium sp.]
MQKIGAIGNLNRQKLHLKGISGSTLKLIAVCSMLVDHIGGAVLLRVLIQRGAMETVGEQAFQAFLEINSGVYYTYQILRAVGRMAFPIFCFLLVQGFLHTHNLKKYLGRLFLFALISEVPFDLAFSGNFFYWYNQNVCFTLFLGVLTLAGIRMVEEKKKWHIAWRILCELLCVGLGAGAATLLCTEYDLFGILVIVAFYFLRGNTILSVGTSCMVLCVQGRMAVPSFASLLPIYLYNGKRGSNIKWSFYLFYPIHILLLYLLACALGLGNINML